MPDLPPDAVIDLGAGRETDERADYTTDLYADADFQFDLREPWPFDDASVGGLIARHVFEHFTHDELRSHVIPEAVRVLRSGGWLEVRTPLGSDARTDPQHKSRWEWRTPLFYADDDAHWSTDHGLGLESRRMHVWMIRPLEVFTPLVRLGARRWPMEFWYELPGATGELVSRFTKT